MPAAATELRPGLERRSPVTPPVTSLPSVPGITGSLLSADSSPVGSAEVQVIRPQGPLLRRRGAVTPRTLAGRGAQTGATGATRSGPVSMDVVAAGYTHIRRDLIRILILALVMLAIIVVLSFVLQ